MSLWLVILLAGLLTFATRLSFILLHDHIKLPNWVQRGLRFVPLAVLSALIFPYVFIRNGQLVMPPDPARLSAALAARHSRLPTLLASSSSLSLSLTAGSAT